MISQSFAILESIDHPRRDDFLRFGLFDVLYKITNGTSEASIGGISRPDPSCLLVHMSPVRKGRPGQREHLGKLRFSEPHDPILTAEDLQRNRRGVLVLALVLAGGNA